MELSSGKKAFIAVKAQKSNPHLCAGIKKDFVYVNPQEQCALFLGQKTLPMETGLL